MSDSSCDILKHAVEILEKDAQSLRDKIDSIAHEISTNKEKYMPAVTLINELKVQLKELDADIHSMHLQLSQSDARLEASASSAHKRLDHASDVVEKLEKLPETIRKDGLKFMAFLSVIIIGFGIWTENTLTDHTVRLSVVEKSVSSMNEKQRENSLNISKTYQSLELFKDLMIKNNIKTKGR